MKKKRFLILLIDFILILLLYGNLYHTFSWSASQGLSDVEGYTAVDNGLAKSTKKVLATAINIIRIVGTGIAIIMITYIGIKYMSAAPQEKADFKKSATGMIVGAFVLFGGTNLLSVIAEFATTNISAK